MKQFAMFFLALALITVACRRSNPQPTATSSDSSPVPSEFQLLYGTLSSDLASFETTLDQSWDGSHGDTILAAELLYANGNIGEALLHPETVTRVRLMLDRLQEIGVSGVGIQIADPMLDPAFPRSAEYLEFYKDVVSEVHRRGLKAMVETGPVFADTIFSPVQWDWSGYTNEQYFRTRQAQLLLIAREIRPDYLSLGNEFTTEEMLTGLKFTRREYLNYLRDTLSKLDRPGGTLAGAGTGTWEDPAYLEEMISATSLDFINLHMYPVGRDGSLLKQALEIALKARAAGKRVVIGETWLYKATPQELAGSPGGNFTEIIGRDVYSFWAPLDARYMEDVVKLADVTGMDFVNFFWTSYFFANLDYESTSRLASESELNRQVNQAAFASMEAGQLSDLGRQYQQFLKNR